MVELVGNRLYAYADDSTLLAVVRKPADRPAVAASLNRDLTCLGFRSGAITGAWFWILTKLRLKWLIDSGLSTLPSLTWSCLWFQFALVPSLTLYLFSWLCLFSWPCETHVCMYTPRCAVGHPHAQFVDSSSPLQCHFYCISLAWTQHNLCYCTRHMFMYSFSCFTTCYCVMNNSLKSSSKR